MKTKIAFISDAIFPYNKGGKETRLHELTKRLAKKGYDVHIYCMKFWSGDSSKFEDGVCLHGICSQMPLYSGDRRSIKQGVLFGLSCLKLIFFNFDIADVDHMPFFPIFTMRLVCWLKNKTMVGTWHEVWNDEYWQLYLGKLKGQIATTIEKLSVNLPDKIVSVSELTTERLKKQMHYGKSVYTISNGIDLLLISETKKSNLKSDIIFAGRLLPHKNINVLIGAIPAILKKHPKLKTFIIGEGPEKNKLINLTKELSLEDCVKFFSFGSTDQLYGLMKASKVFVLPSNREGFGLTILESLACKLIPVTISHPDNAASKLINLNGYISAFTSKDLSQTILKALNTSFNEQEHLAKYDWDNIVNEYEKRILV